MDNKHFNELVEGVKAMKRHLANKPVHGTRSTELPAPGTRSSAEQATKTKPPCSAQD